MPIFTPGRHSVYEPIGRLRSSPFKSGKKSGFTELNLTAMVDMFTVIVIFLLQMFSGEGEVSVQKGLRLPDAEQAKPLEERGPILVIDGRSVMMGTDRLATISEDDPSEAGIPELTERLTEIKERDQQLRERIRARDPSRADEAFDGHLIIQADEKTDFKLVRKVVYSANAAEWIHINFIVTRVHVGGSSGGGHGG